ncbi:MAG: preprotein translocase subunit SecE [Candidatus Schekmanbacteria bacterium RBG_13_48_7]|uniref:Protein translocase subunit SecE n=1 Tax=Candidatus Schekmanbacteria bacterium RBG_13_48_7 TaxID=1817878 RepID=A0A1F7RIL5_9BACT|nr:MAG: preprotein translocase subunit SecE [Candidatus Schekmanbacteria bacterium RBG_13_48_7]
MIQKSIQFLKEVRVEVKKVSWPSRKDTAGATFVVILLTIISGLYLFLCDLILSKGMAPLFLGKATILTGGVVVFLVGIMALIYYTTKK